MKIRRISALFLVVILMFSLSACKSETADESHTVDNADAKFVAESESVDLTLDNISQFLKIECQYGEKSTYNYVFYMADTSIKITPIEFGHFEDVEIEIEHPSLGYWFLFVDDTSFDDYIREISYSIDLPSNGNYESEINKICAPIGKQTQEFPTADLKIISVTGRFVAD